MSDLTFSNKNVEQAFQEILFEINKREAIDKHLDEIDLRRAFVAGERCMLNSLYIAMDIDRPSIKAAKQVASSAARRIAGE